MKRPVNINLTGKIKRNQLKALNPEETVEGFFVSGSSLFHAKLADEISK